MHVVWKRPDGFHGAEPNDFVSADVGGRSKIWLHKSDNKHFPFRVSGGWQESEATARLNNLINLVEKDDQTWVDSLLMIYNDSMKDEPEKFMREMVTWLGDLRNHLKGDTWEVDIMDQVLMTVAERLKAVSATFVKQAHT